VTTPILITIPLTPEMRKNLTHTRNLTIDVTTVVETFLEERTRVCLLLVEAVESLRKKCGECRVSFARLQSDPVCAKCRIADLIQRADAAILEIEGTRENPISAEEFVVGKDVEVHVHDVVDKDEN
jgi:hypothetical protein